MTVKVDEEKCTGCGICVEACPLDAIIIDQVAKIDAAICTDCCSCIAECPNDAIFTERMAIASSARNVPSVTLSRTSTKRPVTLPPHPRSPVGQPRFQQVNWGGILEKIFDLFTDRFVNQGRGQGQGSGRGKGRGVGRGRGGGRGRGIGMGRGKGRW